MIFTYDKSYCAQLVVLLSVRVRPFMWPMEIFLPMLTIARGVFATMEKQLSVNHLSVLLFSDLLLNVHTRDRVITMEKVLW